MKSNQIGFLKNIYLNDKNIFIKKERINNKEEIRDKKKKTK